MAVAESYVFKRSNDLSYPENPSDYTESTKYLSWERYFTHVLEEHTKGTELEYHKKKLNKQYLYAKAMKILSKFLLNSNINFDRCMV